MTGTLQIVDYCVFKRKQQSDNVLIYVRVPESEATTIPGMDVTAIEISVPKGKGVGYVKRNFGVVPRIVKR